MSEATQDNPIIPAGFFRLQSHTFRLSAVESVTVSDDGIVEDKQYTPARYYFVNVCFNSGRIVTARYGDERFQEKYHTQLMNALHKLNTPTQGN